MRSILLKVECKKSGGCCGGSNKPSIKYGLLEIGGILDEESGICTPPEDIQWVLLKASPLYGNIITMAKKHATTTPEWAGTVITLGLDKDEDFMAQLNALKIIKKGCVIVK